MLRQRPRARRREALDAFGWMVETGGLTWRVITIRAVEASLTRDLIKR